MHWHQLLTLKDFRRFDYGDAEKNRNHYGTDVPPQYNISGLKIPMAIFEAVDDDFITPVDVETLRSKLHNEVTFYHVYPEFAHWTFEFGDDTTSYWRDDLIAQLRTHFAMP